MFERFYPHKLAGNVFELGVDFYISRNIRGVIFDIDNTLVTHDTARPPKEIADYFRSLREAGIRCGVVSNNYAERWNLFAKTLAFRLFPVPGNRLKKISEQCKKLFRSTPKTSALSATRFLPIYTAADVWVSTPCLLPQWAKTKRVLWHLSVFLKRRFLTNLREKT